MFSCSNHAVVLFVVLVSCLNVWVWHANVTAPRNADCESSRALVLEVFKTHNFNRDVDLDIIIAQLNQLDRKIDQLHVRLSANILAQQPQVVINATQSEQCNGQQLTLLDLIAAEFNKVLGAAGSAFASARLAGALTVSVVWRIACKAVRVFGPGVALILGFGFVLRAAERQ